MRRKKWRKGGDRFVIMIYWQSQNTVQSLSLIHHRSNTLIRQEEPHASESISTTTSFLRTFIRPVAVVVAYRERLPQRRGGLLFLIEREDADVFHPQLRGIGNECRHNLLAIIVVQINKGNTYFVRTRMRNEPNHTSIAAFLLILILNSSLSAHRYYYNRKTGDFCIQYYSAQSHWRLNIRSPQQQTLKAYLAVWDKILALGMSHFPRRPPFLENSRCKKGKIPSESCTARSHQNTYRSKTEWSRWWH